jgi:hypothetical protein
MVSLPGSAFANLNSADLRSTRRFSEFANGIVLWRDPMVAEAGVEVTISGKEAISFKV